MKKINIISALIFISIIALYSCTEESPSPLTGSEIDTSTPELSELDIWLRENFTIPYNIEVKYKWDESEVDQNRYLYPPLVEKVKPAMNLVKQIWIDSYSKNGGEDFVKKIAPRVIFLVGGINRNASGTQTLGLAEGGKKVTLFRIDMLDVKSRPIVNRFMSTVQHEYTHILNQTKSFDEEVYAAITPSGYTAQWFNSTDSDSRELGFISSYARASESEDFAEMVEHMLIYDKEEFEAIIDAIESEEAKLNIRKKEAIVVNYFKSEFDIDIYELQKTTTDKTKELTN